MATDVPVRPADAFAGPPAPFRPDRPDRGRVAVRLRRLIGVREDVLDYVPEERPRYTRYGVVVLNTALLAGLSMAVALATYRSGMPLAALITVAVVWSGVILSLDSWLVSTTHGIPAGRLLRTVLPRLVISLLLSISIAEPLLFQFFDKEIRQQIAVSNDEAVKHYEGMLIRCNPKTGEVDASAACHDYQLNVKNSPAQLAKSIAGNTDATQQMQSRVEAITKTSKGNWAVADRECDRKKWIWITPTAARTTETCENAKKSAKAYDRSSRIDYYQGQLKKLTTTGTTLSAQQDRASASYGPALQRTVAAAVHKRRAELADDGLLTRAHALEAVAWNDWFAALIFVVVHLLLLGIDSMPVLGKLMSGSTTYDGLLVSRFETSRRIHADEIEVQYACAEMEHEVQRHRVQQETTERMQRLEHEQRLAQAERSLKLRAELDRRSANLLRGDRR
ncbi:DUF4407 domain-containing protein [Streptomyces coacervatus]|uniref:DUF4407 domain-containing protein n=1 Tax=Streptomyces coacervatus TaxID=647381 RepID=A0ABP7HV18_9ACTN|nr:DUF4407 domain-containing protein [Streptomyces coacervatus]MDF2267232.1 DUF4407 domain-containing protein [Streptomyces coacervatus]